jgi:carotenoid cleavage dioxygenase
MDALAHSEAFRQGLFEPVADEAVVDGLKVEGELPRELDGIFVRNGANPRFTPRGRYHWFDGDGMVHGVHVSNGAATYRNRYVKTKAFEKETREGKALWSGIMEPVDVGNPFGPVKDTANTDVTWHARKLLATWWLSGEAYELAVPSLETAGPCRFGSEKPVRFASHPKVCPETGELMVFDYSVIAPPYLQYGVISREGALVRKIPIDLPGPRLLHDIAITRNHTVFLDFPMMWQTDKLKAGKRRVVFETGTPSRFGVIPRHGGAVRWFDAPACYVYHTINAHEEGDEIVFTGSRIENPLPPVRTFDGKTPHLDFIELVPFLHRWRFNLVTGAVREEKLDDVPTEFPRINGSFQGRASRYSYNVRLAPTPTLLFDGFVKYDFKTGASRTYRHGPGRYGSEGVYVPRPGARDEDDGWLLSLVSGEGEPRAELVVLDAREIERGPIARVLIPRRVPIGFHACWVPGSEI